MKLSLSPREFLALYGALQSWTLSDEHDDCKAGSSEAQLLQVFNRMRSCVISALDSSQRDDRAELWFKQQERKIRDIESQSAPDGEELVSLDDVDPAFSYPRRSPSTVRQGKHRGNKG